jgi:hypothetical protein
MLRFKQFILLENADTTFDWDEGNNFGKRKKVVRPSKITIDPAAKELSHEFAAFMETDEELAKLSDEELIKRFEPHRASLSKTHPHTAKILDFIDAEHPLVSGEDWGSTKNKEMAREIRDLIYGEKKNLEDPGNIHSGLRNDPTEYGRLRSIYSKNPNKMIELMQNDHSIPVSFWHVPERPTDPRPMPHKWRRTHEYQISNPQKYDKLIQRSVDVVGKVGTVMDPVSTAIETAAAKISPTLGSVASMYGLADAIFGKEANSPTTMMEPEKQEQEEKDELLSAAMNPSNNPVPQIAPAELKRSEWRRNNTFK